MSDAELAVLLDEFKRLYESGTRPDPAAFLERAGDGSDDLADLLDAYLSVQAAPATSLAELDQIALSPMFEPPTWAEILVDTRQEQGILRSDVVDRLTSALGLRPDQRERVAEHLHDLETGALPPRGVSQRVVDALDGILRGIGAALDRTRLIEAPPMAMQSPIGPIAFSRDAVHEASVPEPHSEPDAEVDALFFDRAD